MGKSEEPSGNDVVYPFGEAFQRKILALAVRGFLPRMSRSFHPRFFRTALGESTPRSTIAQAIWRLVKQYSSQLPSEEVVEEELRVLTNNLGESKSEAIWAEFEAVKNQNTDDYEIVLGKLNDWAKTESLAQFLFEIAPLVQEARERGESIDLREIRRRLDRIAEIDVSATEDRSGFLVGDFVERAEAWVTPDFRPRIPTGFPSLDKALGGGPKTGECFYILAPPKGAKTCSLLNFAVNAARRGKGVAYFSYEMDYRDMLMRMDRNLSNATKQELNQSVKKLKRAIDGVRVATKKRGEIFVRQFVATKHGCTEAAHIVEKLRSTGMRVDVVILDYLNIMASETLRDREKRHVLAAVSREMSELAKYLDVVVWSAALVNRKAVEKDVFRKADIAESFEVIAVGDGFIAVCGKREEVESGFRRLYVAAARDCEDEVFAGTYKVDLDRMRMYDIGIEADPNAQEEQGGTELFNLFGV